VGNLKSEVSVKLSYVLLFLSKNDEGTNATTLSELKATGGRLSVFGKKHE
jgi:hypothetical protein